MPWSNAKDIPPAIKAVTKGNLAWANEIARIADGLKKAGAAVDNVWAVAIAKWRKMKNKTGPAKKEFIALLNGLKEESYDEIASDIRNAWNTQHPSPESSTKPDSEGYGFVVDVYPSKVIVCNKGKHFEYSYTADFDGNVTFGDPVNVEKAYVPAMSPDAEIGFPEIGFRGIKAFENTTGKYLILWTSNAFEDREKEIFATKAWEDYVDRRDRSNIEDRVWFWHLKGTDFATVVWQDVAGKFLLEVAKVDDTPYGNKMYDAITHPERFPSLLPQGWGTSHGYVYRMGDKQGGVYNWVEKFETTVLPFHRSCNLYGGVKGTQEVLMSVRQKKEKVAGLASIIGAETANQMLSDAEAETERLKRKGIGSKATAADDEEEEVVEVEEETADADVEAAEEEEEEVAVDERAAKDDESTYELELDDAVVAEIAQRVAGSKEFAAALAKVIGKAVTTAVATAKKELTDQLTAAAKEAAEDTLEEHKEKVVKDVLKGSVRLRPYTASKDNGNVVDVEDDDTEDDSKEDKGSGIRKLPGGDIVHNVVQTFLSGR